MKVTFYSPGTFVPEESVVETTLTDPENIKAHAHDIVERHGARPFCFRMETQPDVTYWLGGKIMTYDEVPDTPENEILRWNMKYNHMDRIIENNNSWRHVAEFKKNDILLEWSK